MRIELVDAIWLVLSDLFVEWDSSSTFLGARVWLQGSKKHSHCMRESYLIRV